MSDFWKKLSPFESKEEDKSPDKIDVNKDLSDQMKNVSGAKPVQIIGTNPVYAQTTQAPVQMSYPQQNYGTVNNLPDDEKQRWDNYFRDLFNSINDPKPSYHEFIAMADAMGNMMPDQQKFPSVFAGFKIQGLTKEILQSTAEDTLKLIQDNVALFQKNIEDKRNKEVVAKQNLAAQKQQELQKIQEDIYKLQQEATEAEQKIQLRITGYNLYSQMYLQKINNDLNGIKNFVQ